MASDWSRMEVEAVVADYFAMLERELRGEEYNKTAHRNALLPLLNGRSHGSVERKHQNISAVLIELGYPYISGYKPLSNYQQLLASVVAQRIEDDLSLEALVSTAVAAAADVPTVDDILARLVPAPEREADGVGRVREPIDASQTRRRINHLEQEARNASLGRAGELFVVRYEQARLVANGRANLDERVEHLAVTEGDGAGFDILSFELNGADRCIEVKTTAYGGQTPIFASANEVRVSRQKESSYHLYRLFKFRKDPRMFTVAGALERSWDLVPVQFSGHLR